MYIIFEKKGTLVAFALFEKLVEIERIPFINFEFECEHVTRYTEDKVQFELDFF